jgi:hypothetical protein
MSHITRQLVKSVFQNRNSSTILQSFDMFFQLQHRGGLNLIFDNCHFPTANPHDNLNVHGVPSLGLRGVQASVQNLSQ